MLYSKMIHWMRRKSASSNDWQRLSRRKSKRESLRSRGGKELSKVFLRTRECRMFHILAQSKPIELESRRLLMTSSHQWIGLWHLKVWDLSSTRMSSHQRPKGKKVWKLLLLLYLQNLMSKHQSRRFKQQYLFLSLRFKLCLLSLKWWLLMITCLISKPCKQWSNLNSRSTQLLLMEDNCHLMSFRKRSPVVASRVGMLMASKLSLWTAVCQSWTVSKQVKRSMRCVPKREWRSHTS